MTTGVISGIVGLWVVDLSFILHAKSMYRIMNDLEHLLRDIMEHKTAEIKAIRERTEADQEELRVTVCKPKNVEGHHVYQG